ncbi:MAG: hypothetical protein OIF58_14640 [Cohaesibacter sp.]|nr:hypothetical protein [Cohaesibacter sp.]
MREPGLLQIMAIGMATVKAKANQVAFPIHTVTVNPWRCTFWTSYVGLIQPRVTALGESAAGIAVLKGRVREKNKTVMLLNSVSCVPTGNIMKPWKGQKQKKNAKTPRTRKGSKNWPTSKPASYDASQHKSLQLLRRKHKGQKSLMFFLQRPRNLLKHSWRMKLAVRMSVHGMTWNAK